MLKSRLLSSVIVVLAGLFAASALAGGDKAGKQEDLSFQEVDKDGNGYISKSELQAATDRERVSHDMLDTNDDGRLDRTEFAAFERMQQPAGQGRYQTDESESGSDYDY